MTVKELERAAIEAHRRGLSWSEWFPAVAGDVLDMLDVLDVLDVLDGIDGIDSIDLAAAAPSDTETAARCMWRPEVAR